jgi:excisionase family DNA binding protein
MPTRRTKARIPAPLSLFPVAETRDPEVLDVQGAARMLGISTRAVYALFKKGELPGRKVARRWLTTRDAVLKWLKGSSEEDTLARALANGDKTTLTKALKSGKVNIKKRQ